MRVLVVEDVRRLADDIAEGPRDKGMAVDVAYTGLDAAAKLDINRYDVVVLDRDQSTRRHRQIWLGSATSTVYRDDHVRRDHPSPRRAA